MATARSWNSILIMKPNPSTDQKPQDKVLGPRGDSYASQPSDPRICAHRVSVISREDGILDYDILPSKTTFNSTYAMPSPKSPLEPGLKATVNQKLLCIFT